MNQTVPMAEDFHDQQHCRERQAVCLVFVNNLSIYNKSLARLTLALVLLTTSALLLGSGYAEDWKTAASQGCKAFPDNNAVCFVGSFPCSLSVWQY